MLADMVGPPRATSAWQPVSPSPIAGAPPMRWRALAHGRSTIAPSGRKRRCRPCPCRSPPCACRPKCLDSLQPARLRDDRRSGRQTSRAPDAAVRTRIWAAASTRRSAGSASRSSRSASTEIVEVRRGFAEPIGARRDHCPLCRQARRRTLRSSSKSRAWAPAGSICCSTASTTALEAIRVGTGAARPRRPSA